MNRSLFFSTAAGGITYTYQIRSKAILYRQAGEKTCIFHRVCYSRDLSRKKETKRCSSLLLTFD
ncbi:hypothetical protein HA44_05605 [Mixta gaviniae]|nr:hypothetical protein HA44_05605 [Mixta gaviniae]